MFDKAVERKKASEPINWLTPQIRTTARAWSGPCQVSHVGSRDPITHHCAPPGYTVTWSWIESQ